MIGTKIIPMIMIVLIYINIFSYNFSSCRIASQIKDAEQYSSEMNQKSITFAIAVIIATAIAVGFAVPQQALAYHHHHHNHDNSITVDQQINQANECFNGAQCVNQASNNADIH